MVNKKEENMDIFVTLIIGILSGIILALVAVFTKKSKWKILIFGMIGLLIGILIGYLLAPFVLSFK
jgi:1,4-dihydroxy-2-naphthoate octaprenyltransferase